MIVFLLLTNKFCFLQGTEDFHVPSAPKHIECDEDNDFVSMFDKMLNENIAESRSITNRIGGQQVPPAQGRSAKKTYGKKTKLVKI